ncbi:histidinol-phosphate transaminase [Glaciecola sp. SC05]|uniref:histidinol-phosphate transaminase n=1 Tax=Glaciecola sp. SC05 TaxID=1987355 RepID=UPI0035279775
MSKWLNDLTNLHVRELKPYESARRLFSAGDATSNSAGNNSSQQIWLNANESPQADQYTVNSSAFNRYPDCQPLEVINAYAKYAGVNNKQLVATRGADEGIELIIRAYCAPGSSSVLICPPTYGMYAISAQTFNVGVHKAPLNPDFSLDIDAIAEHVGKVNVVFLCSPNNPTGTRIKQSDVLKVLELFSDKALVVLDEAYIEFDIDAQQTALLKRFSNLIILRTLSKAFALAGIRCGFVLSSQAICTTLMKVIAPYPVPAPVAQVAAQALNENGILTMRKRVEDLQTSLQSIFQTLHSYTDITVCGDTKANFLLFKSEHNPALMQYLVQQGVIIRDQSKQLNLQNCLRITVGSPVENDKLLGLIDTFFQQHSTSSVRNAS